MSSCEIIPLWKNPFKWHFPNDVAIDVDLESDQHHVISLGPQPCNAGWDILLLGVVVCYHDKIQLYCKGKKTSTSQARGKMTT